MRLFTHFIVIILYRGYYMNSQRAYNKRMEQINLQGTKKQRRKKYKAIIEEMGARGITLVDLANNLKGKDKGFLDMKTETGMTLDEAVVVQQYAKAIIDKDTRAAEFLRDSVGEKPSQQIDVNGEVSGLSAMSLDELLELRDLLKNANKED